MLDRSLRPPRVLFWQPSFTTATDSLRLEPSLPFVNDEESRRWLVEHGVSLAGLEATAHASNSRALPRPPADEVAAPALESIGPLLRDGDLAFANIECPLSDRGRPTTNDAYYRASPSAAKHLAQVGFRVASFSNNHCLDFGEVAFLDTIEALSSAGVAVTGAARTLREARLGVSLQVGGAVVGALAYNLAGPPVAYATATEPGVVPLNDLTATEDLALLRRTANVVIVSVHWGLDLRPQPTSQMVRLAHVLVENGADIVLGHHPHVPGAIEVYRGRLVCYSLGNLIFGHTHAHWPDNILVRVTAAPGRVLSAQLIPIGGEEGDQWSPTPLVGKRAEVVLAGVAAASAPLGTAFARRGDTAWLEVQA